MFPRSTDSFNPVIGAEARIDLVDWYGEPAVRKSRIPKLYRNNQLDVMLRRERTKEEVEILHAAKLAGVVCPAILFADPVESEIIMEYVPGILLRNVQEQEAKRYFALAGCYAGMLHSHGIIHGDLTTKNMIVSGERLVFIDFGLAFFSDRIEDRAEDLHLLKQVLKSTDYSRTAAVKFETAMKSYEEVVGKRSSDDVRKQIREIELRGRYATVD